MSANGTNGAHGTNGIAPRAPRDGLSGAFAAPGRLLALGSPHPRAEPADGRRAEVSVWVANFAAPKGDPPPGGEVRHL
jgi:hypothetical protein